jgi:nicotinamide riboside transporter PnuC
MSWIFSALIVLSIYLIGKKNKWGWMIANIGALGFIYIYINKEIYGGIALDLTLLVLNTINFIKWHKSDKQL